MPVIPPTLGRKPRDPSEQAPYRRIADEDRPDSTKRGYGRRWRKYRAGFLAQNPLCVHCLNEDRSVLATVVDHIIPVSELGEADPLFYVSSNHQPLCFRHHAKKTARDKQKGLTR